MWRQDRLVAAGKTPPCTVHIPLEVGRDIILLGAVTIDWTQREKTADDLAWELFPKPGVMWVPTVRCRQITQYDYISLDDATMVW